MFSAKARKPTSSLMAETCNAFLQKVGRDGNSNKFPGTQGLQKEFSQRFPSQDQTHRIA
jgi:hypothetical protein